MLKLIGGLLVLGCGAAVQLKTMKKTRRELEILAGLCLALRQMESDIRLDLVPMPQLLRRLSRAGPQSLQFFFRTLAQALEQGTALPEAWVAALPPLGLEADEQAALVELCFTGDEEAVRASLSRTEQRLTALLEERRNRRTGKEKLSASLCFSAAAFLILLLI